MRHRICTAATVTAAIVLTAAPSMAGERSGEVTDCVTRAEFHQLHTGMSRLVAQRLLDGPGRKDNLNTGDKFIAREYRACGEPRTKETVAVFYFRDNDRMQEALWYRAQGGSSLIPG